MRRWKARALFKRLLREKRRMEQRRLAACIVVQAFARRWAAEYEKMALQVITHHAPRSRN